MNALSAVGNLLDLPGSSARDLLAGKGLSDSFDQFATPFSDGNRTSGRDLLRHYGMAGQDDNWGNFSGGLAVEAATDPLNLIGGGWLKQAAKARSAAMNANRGIDAANATSMAQRAAGFMPEEVVQHLHPSVLESPGVPKNFYHGGADISFNQYDPNRLDPNALYGKGIYATDSPHVAGGEGGYWTKGMDKATKYEVPEHNRAAFEQAILNDSAGEAKYVDRAYQRLARDGGTAMLPSQARALVQATPPPSGVKMHYMDVRNPLDIEGSHRIADLPDEMRANALEYAGQEAKTIAGDRLFKSLADVPASFASANTTSQISAANRAARGIGYDGIVHKGGQVVGGDGDHNVAIAFNPSQMYQPYIAQALQDLQHVPAHATRTAAALAVHNALRTLRRRDER